MFFFKGSAIFKNARHLGKALSLPLLCFVVACGSTPSTGVKVPATDLASPSSEVQGDQAQASASNASAGARTNGESAVPSWLADGREPEPKKALPRLSFRHLGMHIGGESNSAESKKVWFSDIESGSHSILSCYTAVQKPEVGGSYGIDLYVGRSGGAPEIRGSRQKIGDETFDLCMREVFQGISFHRPERPTVFSYSLLFELESKS